MELEFVQTNAGQEETWQRNRLRNTPIIRFKDYAVFMLVDGVRTNLGRVYQQLATMERRTPGLRYVNARWYSPRWFFAMEGRYYGRPDYTTRKAAAETLVDEWKREQQCKKEAALA